MSETKSASARLITFPLHGIDPETRACRCRKGLACTDRGKHAKYSEWQKLRRSEEVSPGDNTGCLVPAGMFVVDLDVKTELGIDGLATWLDWQKEHGAAPATRTIRTGGGGLHIWFRGVARTDTTKKIGVGVDIIGPGSCVVAPPSLHRSGQRYEEIDDSPEADAPAWLLQKIQRVREAACTSRAWEAPPEFFATGESLEWHKADAIRHLNDAKGPKDGADTIKKLRYLLFAQRLPPELVLGLACGEANDWSARGEGSSQNRGRFEHLGRWERSMDRKLEEALKRGPEDIEPLCDGVGMARVIDMLRKKLREREEAFFSPKDDGAAVALTDGCLTESGLADRLVARYGHQLRCVDGTWYAWDGSRWSPEDGSMRAQACAQENARSLYAGNISGGLDGDDRKLINRAAESALTARGVRNILSLAGNHPKVRALPKHFDADPWILNVENGILDLRTGKLRPHDPEAMCTEMAGAEYDPDATCPVWDRFLSTIFEGDGERIAYVQRMIGYCLTGDVSEQSFWFLLGTGCNGKSTFLDAVTSMLGTYARKLSPLAITVTREEQNSAAAFSAFSDLKGTRLAYVAELAENAHWNAERLKSATGDETLTAKRMGADFFEFRATAKILIAANSEPKGKDTSEGFWRRMRVVPFDVRIPEAERDRELLAKLREELPGMLSWAMRGLAAWRAQGMGDAKKINAATAAYRRSEDLLAQWVERTLQPSTTGKLTGKELFAMYRPASALAAFGDAMTEAAFARKIGPAIENVFGSTAIGKCNTGKTYAVERIGPAHKTAS